MSLFFIGGFLTGVSIVHNASNDTFWYLYHGLYRPHKEHHIKRRERFSKQLAMTEYHYLYYIEDTIFSFLKMSRYFLFGKRLMIKEKSQDYALKLIDSFEFVNNTIENMDQVMATMKKNEEKIIIEGSYQHLAYLERLSKEQNVNEDDLNLNNIQAIKSMNTDDEYEKYLLENAVMTKEDYNKTLLPGQTLTNNINNYVNAEMYNKSLNAWKNKSNDVHSMISDLREKRANMIDPEDIVKKNYSQNVNELATRGFMTDNVSAINNKKRKGDDNSGFNDQHTINKNLINELKDIFDKKI
jgi:hypothetical protein